MRAALVVVLIAGCVRSAAVDCGDGTLCAADQACLRATADVTVCVAPELLGTCDTDGDECGDHGRCYAGACLPIACGDLLVDPRYEQCDDGNTTPGDGCSADCASTETCGNGVVDPIHAEQCDDGNAKSFDGCSDTCAPEQMTFSQLYIGVPQLIAIAGYAERVPMAYLPSARRVIAVADASQETWQWNGAGWLRAPISTAVAPTPRIEGSLVYDPDRGTVLLLGGRISAIDMWEWDGARWTLRDVSAPNAGDESVAYDAGAHALLVFGGWVTDQVSTEHRSATWSTWDGAHWTTPDIGGPSGRVGAAMAYDAAHDRVVLFGGDDGTARADTWQWHAAAWTQLTPATSPPPRSHAALFPDGGGLMLYGGTDASGNALDDAWRWDGATWSALGPQAPGARPVPSVAVDTDRHRAVLFGPTGVDTWEWDGAQWTKSNAFIPPSSLNATGVWDATRMRPIAVTDQHVAEVKDGVWLRLGAAPVPSRHGGAIFYDRANDRLVEFGGAEGGGQYFGDTQVAPLGGGGLAWTGIATSGPAPDARLGAGIAYDDAHAQAILFGGADVGQVFDDTWMFDGAWHQLTPATSPRMRSSPAVAYDPVRREIIMFGGAGKSTYLDETWRWDGTSWTQLSPPGPVPPARFAASLTWNPGSQRLTLYGGAFAGQLLGDVWEWDGTRWTEQFPTNTPFPRFGQLAMPSSDQSGIVLFGGDTTNGVVNEEFSLGWRPLRP